MEQKHGYSDSIILTTEYKTIKKHTREGGRSCDTAFTLVGDNSGFNSKTISNDTFQRNVSRFKFNTIFYRL